jgi:hypothetical protein
MGGKGIKENDGGVNSTTILLRALVNATMYPQYNDNKKGFKKINIWKIQPSPLLPPKRILELGTVAHTYNPSYLRG